MTFDEILDHFPGPRKEDGNGGWMVTCPCHVDTTPSLHISPGNGAGPLFYDFGGCKMDDILTEVGLGWNDILPTYKPAPRRRLRVKRDIRYKIRNENGQLVAVHVRKDQPGGKVVWWEQPNGTRGLEGIKLVDLPLYGVERLVDALDEEPVIVTEGEKATDAASSKGLFAVGTVTGSNGTPGDDALRPLLDRPVYLWPDNDDVGRAHMQRIGAALLRLGHRNVRTIDWTFAPDKGDAADFFQRKGAWKIFHALLETAEPFEEATAYGPVPIFTRCAAEIEPKPMEWLWPNRLARGKLTMFASDPGLGKSLLSVAVAATVSKGGEWPAGEGSCEPGEVLMATYEDDLADTVVPRLHAAGADLTRIHFLERVSDDQGPRAFNMSRDADRLDALLTRHPNVRLLTIDPISVGMGGIDSHKNNEVRSVLHPLVDVAQQHGVAVMGITHFPKGEGGKALYKVIGSIAFVAAARIAFIAARDKDDPTGERHLFLPIKSNIGDDRVGLAYHKRGITLPSGIEAWRIEWGEHVNITADEAIASLQVDRGALKEAKDFLLELLEDGPVKAWEVIAKAKKEGIKPMTLRRARKELNVKTEKKGMKEGWEWMLQETTGEGAQEGSEGVPTRKSEHLRRIKIRKPATGWASAEDVHLPKK
jgi:putative DNA primase/helicase